MSDHRGQHSNCRRCGTNARAKGENPRGALPPAPPEQTHSTALDAEMARNLRRLKGLPPECGRCDDTGVWFTDDNIAHPCEHLSTRETDVSAKSKGPTALYRYFDRHGQLLYVGITDDPGQRWHDHKSMCGWFTRSWVLNVEWFPTRQEAEAAERAAIRRERPPANRKGKPPKGQAYDVPRDVRQTIDRIRALLPEDGKTYGDMVTDCPTCALPTLTGGESGRRCYDCERTNR